MPSYTVNTAADSGTGSLRQAILDANIAGGSSTITFAASVGTITLASALPVLKASVSIDGSGASGGHLAIDGAGLYRIFFAGDGNAISLDLLHLTLQNGRAKGGNGGDGGGGGMGAGAGLFLNQNVGANLTDVQFVNNAAVGGNGSVWTSTGYGGGGGGLGGNGGVGTTEVGAGGGGGYAGNGGNGFSDPPGGIAIGGGGGGELGDGASGQLGGAGGLGGGGNGGSNDVGRAGTTFGGGGGTGTSYRGGTGGDFGGGGGGGTGGSGGFGGGGGSFGGPAGFGGGNGGLRTGIATEGGSAFGGALFVRRGASLTISDGSFAGGTVTGGSGGTNGPAVGSGFFLGADVTYAVSSGTTTLSDTIGGLQGNIEASGGIQKTGAGTLDLTSANSYVGTTTVAAGKLLVDGSITSATTVQAGATLGGHGTITGAVFVQAGATLAPGNSPGILHTGNLSLAGTTQIELNGAAVGSQYDQIDVTGTVALGGTLSVSVGGGIAIGNVLTIVKNDGADAVTGTFAGLAQNAIVTANGMQFRLDYAGGDGNDVTLTALTTNIPAPAPDPSTVWTGPFLRTVADANGSVLSGTFGNDAFVGGAGRDTVVLRVQFADTTIEQRGDGLLAITSALGTDTMRNVEQVAFANGTLRLDLGGTRATAIEALYHAALGRAPDAGGLQVQLDSGIDVRTLAHAFADSPEFQRRWGGAADIDLVRSLYDNVLNRQPDLGGFLAQLDALAHGTSRADLLANFALSGEAVQVLARQHPTGVFVSDLFAF